MLKNMKHDFYFLARPRNFLSKNKKNKQEQKAEEK